MRRAILRHQNGNHCANLIWGPTLALELACQVSTACKGLSALGYEVSPFPEGDGVTFTHPQYSKETALGHVEEHFRWLAVTDKSLNEDELYEDAVLPCKVLVPVEKLHLTVQIQAPPYLFIPAIGIAEDDSTNPWLEYFGVYDIDAIYGARDAARETGALGLTREEFLVTFPLVEMSLDIPCRELIAAERTVDGMSPLLRRCSEYADRGLDLLRLDQCTYRQLERLCGLAGQMADGFHAAYVIPPFSRFKSNLYCHYATPFQVSPNWLGLDVDRPLDAGTIALAPIAFGTGAGEMLDRIRSAIRTAGQAFYILTPEARFLSLVFGLDGLCAPKSDWTGFKHRTYIAAIGSDGDASSFRMWLRDFNAAYSEIRNPIVHRGKSFIELGIDPKRPSDELTLLLRSCVDTVLRHALRSVADLRAFAIASLASPPFQAAMNEFITQDNARNPSGKPLTMPTW